MNLKEQTQTRFDDSYAVLTLVTADNRCNRAIVADPTAPTLHRWIAINLGSGNHTSSWPWYS